MPTGQTWQNIQSVVDMMNERIEELLDQIRVNEQIERLAKQVGCTIDRLGYGEGNLEKFAELIVQDCIDIISPYTVSMNRPGEEFLHPIQEIRKHFGVNE